MSEIRRVAVIGAGLAGLAAARTLNNEGVSVSVFEKADKPGGRLVSARIGDFLFDIGATSVAGFGQALEKTIVGELPQDGLTAIEKPVYSHDGCRCTSRGVTASKVLRYTYEQGMQHLADLLSEGIDLRLGCNIASIKPGSNSTYEVYGELFDGVIVAIPIPLASELLLTSGESRKFSNARFRSCISIAFGFDVEFEAPYHALVGPDQAHPLAWLSFESLKCKGRAPVSKTAIVAQLSAEYSKRRFLAEQDLIIQETLSDITRLLGSKFDTPEVCEVFRFPFSHPEMTTSFEFVNSSIANLVMAGDGLLGGRTELAYETGIRAAKLLMYHS